MKRLITIASLLAIVISFGTTKSQAFVSRQVNTLSASVTTGGVKMSSFTLSVNNAVTGALAPAISWSGVDPAVTSWKLADQYIKLRWNVTDINGGIQIYTNNIDGASGLVGNPKFVDPSPTVTFNADSNPAGLLYVGTSTGTSSTLLMAWSIKGDTRTIESGNVNTGIGAADPNGGSTAAVYNNKFQWLFMLDKRTPAIDRNGDDDVTDVGVDSDPFVNGAAYQTVAKQAGIHFGQSPTEFGSDLNKESYIYLQAEFSGAIVQSFYRTATLTLEAFTE